MKSRHRRIKKQRRYERLAATSQLSLWYGFNPAEVLPSTPLGSGLLLVVHPKGFISEGPDYILSLHF